MPAGVLCTTVVSVILPSTNHFQPVPEWASVGDHICEAFDSLAVPLQVFKSGVQRISLPDPLRGSEVWDALVLPLYTSMLIVTHRYIGPK